MNRLYRIEEDSIGVKRIPKDAYYGVKSLRAVENFSITGRRLHPEMIRSRTYPEKSCCILRKKYIKLQKNSCNMANAVIKYGKDFFKKEQYLCVLVAPRKSNPKKDGWV